MEFENTICTSREQSKNLLEIGLSKKTADMGYYKPNDNAWRLETKFDMTSSDYLSLDDYTPAWSLTRLLEICPEHQVHVGSKYVVYYYKEWSRDCEDFQMYENVFDNLIECIKWLISKGEINKDYLL